MVFTGLHKISVRDNHSQALRRCGNEERSTTRTSSIRKMWRDLESEGKGVENKRRQMYGMLTGLESQCSSSRDAKDIENECPQNQNQIALQNGQEDDNRLCLQLSPFDVPEKERVRKLFREWGSKSLEGNTLYSSRMNNYSRAQWLGENECKRVRIVRDWIESNTQEGNTYRTVLEEPATEMRSKIERVRDGIVDCGVGSQRSIRRIYGRQALLDLLTKFRRERERELEGLLEHHFVSNFAHRHRIQSSLKGRFLRNQRFVENEKQTSVAASELGLLRQTYAVSDIRKGFISRLNNHDQAPEGAQSDSDTSSDNEMKYDHIEQSEEIIQEIPGKIGENFKTTNPQEFASPVGERHEEREKRPLAIDHSDSDTSSSDDEMTYDRLEQADKFVQEIPLETTNLTSDWEARNPQHFASPVGQRHHNILQYEERGTQTRSPDQHCSVERNQNIYQNQLSQGTSGTEASVCLHPLQTSTDSFNWQEVSTQEEEWRESATEDDEGGWHHFTHIESGKGTDVNSNDETARSDFQESHVEWDDTVLEDATENWFGGDTNSYSEVSPVGRSNAFHWSDDDNGSKLELRELTSRRRVSNLLHSDFGARLDQLMQSYVDRQDHAFESEDQEQQSLDENSGGIEAVERITGRNVGTDREVIDGLRIDMDTLQQRMNDMQRMLEACMDMQRSVQQEVYSALKRSSNSGGACDSGSSREKEVVCFFCCDDGFESLPDRSARMYICSKCGKKINWSKLKESVGHP